MAKVSAVEYNLAAGLESIGENSNVLAGLGNNVLAIQSKSTGMQAKIPYDQIIRIQNNIEKETIEKDKSILGRAVVGGALFGGAGAVVGGLSGSGKKKKERYGFYTVIVYMDSGEQERAIILEKTANTVNNSRLMEELRAKCKNVSAPIVSDSEKKFVSDQTTKFLIFGLVFFVIGVLYYVFSSQFWVPLIMMFVGALVAAFSVFYKIQSRKL